MLEVVEQQEQVDQVEVEMDLQQQDQQVQLIQVEVVEDQVLLVDHQDQVEQAVQESLS